MTTITAKPENRRVLEVVLVGSITRKAHWVEIRVVDPESGRIEHISTWDRRNEMESMIKDVCAVDSKIAEHDDESFVDLRLRAEPLYVNAKNLRSLRDDLICAFVQMDKLNQEAAE